MKTNRKVWKIVSVIVALAMVVGLLPSGFLGGYSAEVRAATQVDYFNGTGVSTGSTLSGWTWSTQPGTYTYNSNWSSALEIYNSSALTTQFYYTISSLPAGTYTLQYNYYAGSNVTMQPYINGSTEGTTTTISQSSLSTKTVTYSFTTTSAQKNVNIGWQFVISSGGWVHINNLYLYGDEQTYSIQSITGPEDITVSQGTNVTVSALGLATSAAVVTVNDSDSSDTNTETLDLTWDLSAVDTSTAGVYTATYSYTSDFVGDGSGTVNVTVEALSSARLYLDADTGETTTKEVEVTTTEEVELEWGSSNVPGTFESGTLGTSAPSGNGFYASSTTYVSRVTTYKNNGTYSAGIRLGSSQSTLYYGSSDSASTTYSDLEKITLSSSTSFTKYTYTFTPTSTTWYLHFGGRYSAQNSSSYAYLRAYLTGLSVGTEYTVTFYATGYYTSSSNRYVSVDDVTVTYSQETTTTETQTVPVTTKIYYDYAGTYTADTTTVVAGEVTDLSSELPTYVTADLVLEDNDYVKEGDTGYTSTKALPVTWDTSSVDTNTAGIYTVSGTATYADEEIAVTALVYVVEYGTIVSSEVDGSTYGAGCFEDSSVWKFVSTGSGSYTNETNTADEWYGDSPDGSYQWKFWNAVSGDMLYAVYMLDESEIYGLAAGDYTVSFSYIGENYNVELVAFEDYNDISDSTAIVLGTILTGANSNSEGTWSSVSGVTLTLDEIIEGSTVGIGLRITGTSNNNWGFIDSLNISGPIYPGTVDTESIVVPTDQEYAIMDSDLSTNWKFVQMSSTTDETYPFAGYTTYAYNWYWDTTDSYDTNDTEYDYGYAYYKGSAFDLLVEDDSHSGGVYTMEAVVAGEGDVVIYPIVIDSSGNITKFEDNSATITGTWTSPQTVQLEITLDEDLTGVYVGFYVETETEACWCDITGFSWYYGGAAVTIWDDQPENGNFEYGSVYPWMGSNTSDTSTDDDGELNYYYGYVVNSEASGVDGYSLNLWNDAKDGNELETYEFSIYEYIRINTGGMWYLDYEAVGEFSDDSTLTAYIYYYDEDSGETDDEASDTVTMEVPDSYSEWTEYVEALTDANATTIDGEGFYCEDGKVVKLVIEAKLAQGDYVDLDNIKFVDESYVSEGREYIATDCIENGGFDDPWSVSQYWSGTGENDDDYAYGYLVQSAYDATGSDSESSTNAVYEAYNNSEDTQVYTLSQKIYVTSANNYDITFDTYGRLSDDSTVVVTVTSGDGSVLWTYTVSSLSEAWTAMNSDTEYFAVSAGDTITVTVTLTLNGATGYDADGNLQGSYVLLDNFVFEEYVQLSIKGDGSYYPVKWTSSDNTTYYVNGGNYIKGADISSIISLESAGTTFDYDVFQMLKDNGVNSIRIRIWNDPYTSAGITYGGGINDADVAVMIAQRAADVGMGVMLSFHLSDFWADPAAQKVPSDWSSLSASGRASETYEYVYETLEAVLATGVDVQFVTIGNETTTSSGVAGTGSSYYLGDLSGSTNDMATILVEGAKAVRAVDTTIMTGVHVAPTSYGTNSIYYNVTGLANAYSGFWDYFDFFSTSCYPYWTSHGSTTNDMTAIASQLASFVSDYGKPVMITEYNWRYTTEDQDYEVVTSLTSLSSGGYTDGSYGYYVAWDVSRSGQAEMIQDLNSYFATLSGLHDGDEGYFIGTYYWEPAWIAVDNKESAKNWRNNLTLWYNYGCGVATYYGADYLDWTSESDAYAEPSNPSSVTSSDWHCAAGSATDEYTIIAADGSSTAALKALNYSTDLMPILVARAQVSLSATDTDANTYSLRFVGEIGLDSLGDYNSVGFKIEYSDGTNIKSIYSVDSTTLYTKIIADGTTIEPSTDNFTTAEYSNAYFYTYRINGVPASGTYYFKVITNAKGSASYQQSIKYYKYVDGSLSAISAWDYEGSNASLTAYSGKLTLYPSYMQ